MGIKVGDRSGKALSLYREKYIGPESVLGGKLLNVFKVENDQAMILDFDI